MADEIVEEIAIVIYGRGADLGNFKFFADDLVTTELSQYKRDQIIIKNIERRDDFFDFLRNHNFPSKIKEFHIYSHALGGGIALGYGSPELQRARSEFLDQVRGGRANYISVLNTEQGIIFTDDLIRSPYQDYRDNIRSLFAKNSKIKIWGCNSGVSNWVYSDFLGNTPVYDLNEPADRYYWRAINEFNNPKPCIAQAFANYFQVVTIGAMSGSSIQVRRKGKWMPSQTFLKQTGRKFVKEADVLRLAPDQGDYYEFKPQ